MVYTQYILEIKGRVKAGVGKLGDHLNLILFAIFGASRKSLLVVVLKKIIQVFIYPLYRSGFLVWTIEGNQTDFKETATEKVCEGGGVGDALTIRNKLSFQEKAI